LISVYGFGQSPVVLSPLSKNIALVDSTGKRIAPIVFEKKLDSPITGLVQGFVYFPLQTDKDFRIAVRGLVPERETNFTFASASSRPSITTAPTEIVSIPSGNAPSQKKEVVVKIPTPKPPAPNPPPLEIEEDNFGDSEIFPPTVPTAPEPPAPPAEAEVPPAQEAPLEPKLAARQVLDIYLKAWADGDIDRMYSLLSSESQGRISKELFGREAASGGFRSALRSGYKVNWVGNSARVTVAKRILFVRTLETKQIDFTEENDSARISW
jgi:hypothetical protein